MIRYNTATSYIRNVSGRLRAMAINIPNITITEQPNNMQTTYQSKYQTIIKASVAKVWDALTNPEIVKQYFFGSNQETTWEVGSPLLWTGEYEGQTYVDKGVVQEFILNEKVSYSYLSSWSELEDKPENYLLVSYAVKATETGTEVTVTQSNYDEEKAKHSAENWAVVIDGLKKIVENQ